MTDLLLFLTGLLVGTMNAVAGGGMLIGFPILVTLGVPPLVANVTGNLVTGPGQLASAWGYRRYIRKIPRRFALLALPLAAGSAGGAFVLRHTSAQDFAHIVPGLVLFGVLLFSVQPLVHFHIKQHLHGRRRTMANLALIGLALLPLGLYAGYFGAGFGFMMLAFLSFTHLHDTHMLNAMKNLAATIVSAVALVCLYSTHLIDWRVGLITALGAIIGGYTGARLTQHVSSHWLRIAVIVLGFASVVFLALHRY